MTYLYYRLAPRVDNSGAPATQAILPDNAVFEVSDFAGTVVQDEDKIQLIRPFDTGDSPVGGGGLRYASPCARVRFGCILTERSRVVVSLDFVARVTRPDVQNAVGSIFVNDAWVRDFGSGGDIGITLEAGVYDIDVFMPRGGSYDVIRAAIPASGTFDAPSPRPSDKTVFLGDSITNGIAASAARRQWTHLLSAAKDWEQVNLGYGGRQIEPTDATYAGAIIADRTITNAGINNCFAGSSGAAIQAAAEDTITNHRTAATTAGQPTKPFYWINLFDCTNPGLVTAPATARTAIEDAFTAVGGAYDFLIPGGTANGLPNGDSFTDKTHPDDAEMITIASVLGGLIT